MVLTTLELVFVCFRHHQRHELCFILEFVLVLVVFPFLLSDKPQAWNSVSCLAPIQFQIC